MASCNSLSEAIKDTWQIFVKGIKARQSRQLSVVNSYKCVWERPTCTYYPQAPKIEFAKIHLCMQKIHCLLLRKNLVLKNYQIEHTPSHLINREGFP